MTDLPAPIFDGLVQRDERVVSTTEFTQEDGVVLVVPNDGVPTQVANPNRTTRRTLVQGLVALFTAIPVAVPIILGAWSPQWLVAVLAQVLLVHTVATRIMAIPAVNAWIVEHFPALSAIPVSKTLDAA